MRQELDGIFTGPRSDCGAKGFTLVHACKTCHKNLCGQPAKDHPDYLAAEDDGALYLNIIDPEAPLFQADLFRKFVAWAEPKHRAGERILIHCDQGRSRSRSLALLLGVVLGKLPRASFIAAATAFSRVSGEPYRPSAGIRLFLTQHWNEVLEPLVTKARAKPLATVAKADTWKASGAKEIAEERELNGGYTLAELDEIAERPHLWSRLHGKVEERVSKEPVRFEPSPLQARMFQWYEVCQRNQNPCRMVVPKIRRGGGSTGAEAIMYCHAHNYTSRIGSIGTDDEVAMNMQKMVRFFDKHDDFPGWGRAIKILETGLIAWANGSTWDKYTAERPDAARSAGLQGYHACLPGDTAIIMADGQVRPIREVMEGQRVLTHTGATATVTAITGRINRKGALVRITPWSGQGVSMTRDHKVWTKRGMIRADSVGVQDWVSLPVRPIMEERAPLLRLPASRPRRQGGGRVRAQAGQVVPFNRETGFFFGYYLAEGDVKVSDGRVSQLSFARDRDEERFSTRATNAISQFAHKIITEDRRDSRTTMVHVYGSALAQLVNDEFGRVESKHVPDWVWRAGEEFCTGLLLGYLAGDGSKAMQMDARKSGDRITATTIHASIATQMRDLAASLGWGWASLVFKAGGVKYGRECQPAYMLTWNGRAATIARELLGLATLGKKRAGYHYSRSRIERGQAWMQVRKIESEEADVVYDLAVDHSDHTFRTLFFSVSNSEVGRWPNGGAKDAKETLRSMLGAVPRRGFTVVIEESTARGAVGAFYDRFQGGRWPTAEELGVAEGMEFWRKWADETPQNIAGSDTERALQFVRIFAAWFEDDENRPERGITGEEERKIRATLDAKEQKLIARYMTIGPQGERLGTEAVKATVWEQLAWRRAVIATEFEGDEEGFEQENPSSPAEAFASSGRHTFNRAGCAWMLAQAKTKTARIGVLDRQHDGHVIFRETDKAHAWMMLWDEPREGMRYIEAVDTMGGRSNVKNIEDADYNAAHVLRAAYIVAETGEKLPARVVASLCSKNQDDPDVLATRAGLLSDFYGHCLCVHEDNNTGAAFRQEAQRLGLNLYRRVETDKFTAEPTEYVGWQTNAETRPQLFSTGKRHMRHNAKSETRADGVECWNETACQEASDCILGDDGKDAAPGSKHDDSLLALLIGLHCISGATYFAGRRRKRTGPADRSLWRPSR